MNEISITNKEQGQAEKIRHQYLDREADKVIQLKKMDDKVKAPGKIVATILGIVGALVMGTGMANVMVWNNMMVGLSLGIPGLIGAVLAYPVYALITRKRKKKYSKNILKLTNELLDN